MKGFFNICMKHTAKLSNCYVISIDVNTETSQKELVYVVISDVVQIQCQLSVDHNYQHPFP